jgi:hypothetical protein
LKTLTPSGYRVVPTDSQDALVQLLWTAVARNADWIVNYTGIANAKPAVQDAYLKWFFELLKDQVQPNCREDELDRMIRVQVKSIDGRFRDRPGAVSHLIDFADPSGNRFQHEIERADEIRALLEGLPKQIRVLLEDVFSTNEQEFSRNAFAKRLGIKRNTLDQRISRAIKAIRSTRKGESSGE